MTSKIKYQNSCRSNNSGFLFFPLFFVFIFLAIFSKGSVFFNYWWIWFILIPVIASGSNHKHRRRYYPTREAVPIEHNRETHSIEYNPTKLSQYCSSCGSKHDFDDKFCSTCGFELK